MSSKLKLLYLCTGNSCRSQMAEGFTRALKGDQIEVASAGVETHGLNPNAIAVMEEVGIDINGHKSQHINEFKDQTFDVVVTVCDHAHETCPFFPASKVVHVSFPDPPKLARELEEKGESLDDQLDCYRRVRDEIKAFVQTLPGALD